MKHDEATLRQIEAAHPNKSTWLSANAGSGKTRVLTDRVARLLLDGVPPQNILCLTYTKAAASEMQNRLFKRLGQWAMKDDESLRQELAKLGVEETESTDLAPARTLFASALETPGGLRIQTIHSFCASLLRRFPLEAGVSPMFKEMDDRATLRIRDDAVSLMIEDPKSRSLDGVVQYLAGDDFSDLAGAVVNSRSGFLPAMDKSDIWNWFGLANGFDRPQVINQVFLGTEIALLEKIIPLLKSEGKSTDIKIAGLLSNIDVSEPNAATITKLIALFVFNEKSKTNPFGAKTAQIPTKDLRAAHPEVFAELHDFMERVEKIREPFNALLAAEKTAALHAFAAEFLPHYAALKEARGLVDFDDLIQRAGDILSEPAVAQWILFRLDGGLDHILIDEAQDTNPDQWKIVKLLAQEFTAGEGARTDIRRTIFVVGDKKQSIYSFQGADPDAFDQMRQHFQESLQGVDQTLQQKSLEHSFRSSKAVLSFVDQVFLTEKNVGLGGAPTHQVFHTDMPGRVDLWPLVPKSDSPEEKNWYDPTDQIGAQDHRIILANTIADQIREMEKTGSIQDEKGVSRRIQFDDFLILVQSRSPLFHQIIRACKSRNLPIAGADRLKVAAELAVKDLKSLLAFLALPDDDLSLAEALRSPLFGITESQLFQLAHSRSAETLWTKLKNSGPDHKPICEEFDYLLRQVDVLNPFELLERILTRNSGRDRLIARLGPEAEVGIDAILSLSIEYESSQTASLTGFLCWLDIGEVEIKRQTDSAGGRIRVMTTHGAKGLESPIVILPDTGDRIGGPGNEIAKTDGGFPVWLVPKTRQPKAIDAIQLLEKEKQSQERQRLFYVALTRAEKWLIICGSGSIKKESESWYQQADVGMQNLDIIELETPVGTGKRFQHGTWPEPYLDDCAKPELSEKNLPRWIQENPRPPAPPIKPFNPSRSEGEDYLVGAGFAVDREAAIQHGNDVHKLFEVLPTIPRSERENAAKFLFSREIDTDFDVEEARAFSVAADILDDPQFSDLFASDALAEVSISADLSEFGLGKMRGIIDRLVVKSDRILIVDFKTSQTVPAVPNDIPTGILRQLGAYLIGIEQIYDDREIDIAILWTDKKSLMHVPHDIVRNALRSPLHLDDPTGAP